MHSSVVLSSLSPLKTGCRIPPFVIFSIYLTV
ncbi:hypothetical protein BN3661_00596 [Eubacteriaceae bacterium CHKCI005]|nr:hypothetical protein BN3661_00596 [Eubacteriaceae bacterium CHKCI005]